MPRTNESGTMTDRYLTQLQETGRMPADGFTLAELWEMAHTLGTEPDWLEFDGRYLRVIE